MLDHLLKPEIETLLQSGDLRGLRRVLEVFEHEEVAALIDALPVRDDALLFRSLPRQQAASVFEHLPHEKQKALVEAIAHEAGRLATLSLIIRALAIGEVTLRDWWRVIRREVFSGLALGAILGTVGFLRVTVWAKAFGTYGEHWFLIALTVALSLVGVVLWGTLSGSMLPLIMRRLGADPAASSAPFVATLVDVTGLVIYFTVAAALLSGTLL